MTVSRTGACWATHQSYHIAPAYSPPNRNCARRCVYACRFPPNPLRAHVVGGALLAFRPSSRSIDMEIRPTLASAARWLRALAQNRYFWAGMGALFLIGFLAYILVDGVIMPNYTRHGVSVRVPDVEGQPFERAVKRVRKRKLQVKRDVGRYNPRVDQNTVVDQNPPPNSDVKPGRRVYLTVNAGDVPRVRLPDLNGISIREAKNRVASLGLTIDSVKADSVPAPYPNTVTRQHPEPGDSLRKGKGVALWYSTGLAQDTVQVPNVVGNSVEKARSVLLASRLRSIVVDPRRRSNEDATASRADTTETALYVQRQGHPPNTKVRAGTEIRLFTTTDSTVARPRPSERDSLQTEDGL